ncbi:MAG: FAD-dependent thymidylate synthase [Patescibacteria group bacterium]
MSDALAELKKKFRPNRFYKLDELGTTIEVDGVFVRVDERMLEQNLLTRDKVEIRLEDILQDPPVIRSARVSTDRDTKAVTEKAAGMIGSLYGGRHDTPFEGGVVFRLKVTVPICYAKPFFQLPGSHNEFSGRYSEIPDDFFVPPYARKGEAREIFDESAKDCYGVYQKLLHEMSVAKEQARMALPFSFFTKFYWTITLRHLLEVLALEENEFSPSEFWQIIHALIPQILKDWTPWTAEKMEEQKRFIPTKWAEKPPAKQYTLICDALDRHLARKNYVANVGFVGLLGHNAENEKLIDLIVKTGPDPRRGLKHLHMSLFMNYPIFVHRQWVRHRDGAWSEFLPDFDAIVASKNFYTPKIFRKQLGKNMSYIYEDMTEEESEAVGKELSALIIRSCNGYMKLRKLGLTPEEAGLVLPYTYRVSVMWTPNIASLMNFLSLRCDKHAQWEIRVFADIIYGWFKELFPKSHEIFIEHLNFGKSEIFQK